MNESLKVPTASTEPRVTLIVTPRERWGMALQSLESIYAARAIPFNLVYVDGGSPSAVSDQIAEQAKLRGFRHLKLSRYLLPNEARNLGLHECTTPYVVFIDNDVIVSDNWLDWLVRCADETGAEVVAPLTCQGYPFHKEIHQAGGAFAADPVAFFQTPPGERLLLDEMHLQGVKVDSVSRELTRKETQVCEFHCVLVRRLIFDRIGPLDEMLNTRDHLDFCLSVKSVGGKVMLEPKSIITYPLFLSLNDPLTKEDIDYYLLRWSPEWQKRSLDRLEKKWGLKPDGQIQSMRKGIYWRHFEGFVKPRVTKMPLFGRNPLWIRLAHRMMRPLLAHRVRALMLEYDRQRIRDQ